MTHTYNITGMTCNGCVTKVKSELLKLGNVLSADVQLEAPQATITMDKHVPTQVLQQAIGKYIITEAATDMHHSADMVAEDNPSYYPIILIFGFIAGIATLIQLTSGHFDATQWMSHFMAGFFLLFSFFKLLNIKAFAEGYSSYDIIASKIRVYGYVYPFIELGLGIAYLTGFEPRLTNIVTIVVMSVSAIGVIQSLLRKTQFQCACLGTVIKLPLSKVTLFEDLLMVVMSVAMLLM
jgi:copper chaperone CopZ